MTGLVYNNNVLAGYLQKEPDGSFLFAYIDDYFEDRSQPAISLSLLKTKKEHRSAHLFSFFFGLLTEGTNRDIQNKMYAIEENDDFTRLLLTGGNDPIGAICIKPENHELLGMLR